MCQIFIRVCSVTILICSICGCARTAVEVSVTEPKTLETEHTETEREDIKGTDIEGTETATAEDAPIEKPDADAEQWLGEHISGIRLSGITQEDVDRIAGMENLESLAFSISEDNIDLSPLSRLTYLRELTIFFTGRAYDIDLSFVKELRLLTEIYFDKCTSLEDLSLFEDMRCLKDMHVGYVDDVDLNYLSGCVILESVNICGNHIRNVEGLSDLMSLHSLTLMESAPGKEPIMTDLEQISNLKGLESVQL